MPVDPERLKMLNNMPSSAEIWLDRKELVYGMAKIAFYAELYTMNWPSMRSEIQEVLDLIKHETKPQGEFA